MAKCSYCGKDMLKSKGCVKVPIKHEGKSYDPIKVGDPRDRAFDCIDFDINTFRCGDCGATAGHYHHPGCDMETCPVCGGQLISCGCIDEETE